MRQMSAAAVCENPVATGIESVPPDQAGSIYGRTIVYWRRVYGCIAAGVDGEALVARSS